MKNRLFVFSAMTLALFGALNVTQAASRKHKSVTQKASNVQPPKADADMQAVLDALKSLHGQPIEKLSAYQARMQPTPADAVKKVLKNQGKSTAPVQVGSVKDSTIPVQNGDIPVHIYTPEGTGPFPVIVYFHGGGFVIADTKTYDASIRGLVNGVQAIVVSVDYHRSPEFKFPAAPNEAYYAYKWVLEHAAEMNGDPKRVAVAGESAGGNLALGVSIMARDRKIMLPVHELLIYPLVDNNMKTASYVKNANAKPLNAAMMNWFFKQYFNEKDDANSPRAFPNKTDSLKGLPPTTIITAEIDPLHTEGEKIAERLQQEGVPVAYRHYTGVTHEFFGMAAVVAKAQEAQAFAFEELKKSFSTAAQPSGNQNNGLQNTSSPTPTNNQVSPAQQ